MDNPEYTRIINPEDESDDSESRFNRISKPLNERSHQPQPVFESWYDGQLSLSKTISPEPSVESQSPEITRPLPVSNRTHSRSARKVSVFFWVGLLLILLLIPLFIPVKVTTLFLGIDRPPKGTWIGRSDTMILTTLKPASSQVSMVSIPRDLWVPIPSYGENRINAAHYFAELNAAGTGMQAAREVVESNFGINVDYVLRLKFDGFIEVVDAFGGVTVDLPADMSGLTAGKHHLNGTESLKFVRDRKGSDDFYRQQRGQLFLTAAFKESLNPLKWPRFLAVALAISKNVQTDLPFWLWPRIVAGFTISAMKGFDAHTLDRSFVTPWVTEDGAQVLLPNWELIRPEVQEIFN